MRAQVLTKAVIGQDTLLQKAALVLGGTMFIALAAQVAVPFYPVPVTLQTLAILIVGLTFGSRLGAVTLVAYLAEGAMGLPVFAQGMNGVALVGPTAGFLFGFVAMAWLAGLVVEKGLARGVVSTAVCGIAISALLYVPGVAWPMALAEVAGMSGKWVGSSADVIWTYWVAPFLLGDAVKAVIAAMVVWGGWKATAARKS
ncbi:MAG: biotin transporter BioY [Roseovarius sp.]|nr:biotin transporter BioY [Roseovarius sp.]